MAAANEANAYAGLCSARNLPPVRHFLVSLIRARPDEQGHALSRCKLTGLARRVVRSPPICARACMAASLLRLIVLLLRTRPTLTHHPLTCNTPPISMHDQTHLPTRPSYPSSPPSPPRPPPHYDTPPYALPLLPSVTLPMPRRPDRRRRLVHQPGAPREQKHPRPRPLRQRPHLAGSEQRGRGAR